MKLHFNKKVEKFFEKSKKFRFNKLLTINQLSVNHLSTDILRRDQYNGTKILGIHWIWTMLRSIRQNIWKSFTKFLNSPSNIRLFIIIHFLIINNFAQIGRILKILMLLDTWIFFESNKSIKIVTITKFYKSFDAKRKLKNFDR